MTKAFALDAGESLIAAIRPSLWMLVPKLGFAAVFLLFPFVFFFPLLGLGPIGALLGAASLAFGLRRIALARSAWMCGALLVTDARVIDVIRLGKRPRLLALPLCDIGDVSVRRSFVDRVLGVGTVVIGAKQGGVTLVFTAIPRPDAVKTFLLEVQLRRMSNVERRKS